MTHSTCPAQAGAGVFFRDVLRMYDICTTALKTPTTTAGTRVTIEVDETCVTCGIPAATTAATTTTATTRPPRRDIDAPRQRRAATSTPLPTPPAPPPPAHMVIL